MDRDRGANPRAAIAEEREQRAVVGADVHGEVRRPEAL